MRHPALLAGWCLLTAGVWLLLSFVITRFTYTHVSFDLPLWFHDAVVTVWHSLDPDYRPDALDVEDSAALVLFMLAHLVSALIVVPLSTRAWRRRIKPRFTP